MQCGVGTKFFELILEYIDLFYDSFNVTDDLRPYFKMLSSADT